MPIQIPSDSDTDFDVDEERDLEPDYTPTREPLLSTDGLLDNPCPDAFVEDSAELPPHCDPRGKRHFSGFCPRSSKGKCRDSGQEYSRCAPRRSACVR